MISHDRIRVRDVEVFADERHSETVSSALPGKRCAFRDSVAVGNRAAAWMRFALGTAEPAFFVIRFLIIPDAAAFSVFRFRRRSAFRTSTSPFGNT
jgi:hypothetical protein